MNESTRARSAPPDMMKIQDLTRSLNLLSNMYLCGPTAANIESWKALLEDEVPDPLRGLKTALQEIDLASEAELEAISWEHTRLFVGPYKLPCPPWESVYTSPSRLMMQEAYTDMKRYHQKAGLELQDPNVLHDHIGAELAFLAALLVKGQDESARAPDFHVLAGSFLEKHMLNWVPRFTSDLETATDSPVYMALATATRETLSSIASFP